MQADEQTSALKPAWREFFQFERRETIAFGTLALVLAVGCAFLWLAPTPAELRVVQWSEGPEATRFPVQIAEMASPRVVNLNTATRDELVSLPGIGPKKAQAILDDRAARGRFSSVDALDRVKGIGPATVARLRPHVTVADGVQPGAGQRPPGGGPR